MMCLMNKRLLTYVEAAEYLGLTRSALAQRKLDGQFPSSCWTMIGSTVKWDRVALDSWIESQKGEQIKSS